MPVGSGGDDPDATANGQTDATRTAFARRTTGTRPNHYRGPSDAWPTPARSSGVAAPAGAVPSRRLDHPARDWDGGVVGPVCHAPAARRPPVATTGSRR